MEYVVDVVETRHRSGFAATWYREVGQLRTQPGFWSAELFEMVRDIRDAHYDFVCVYAWRHIHGAGALPPDLGAWPNDAIERTRCGLEIHLTGGGEDDQTDDAVWLVNPFEITNEQIGDVLDMWDKAKDHMMAQPGFVDARLFRASQDGFRYGLVNVARWRTAEHFMRALGDKAYDRHREKSMNYQLHPSLCKRVGLVHANTQQAATA